VKDSQKVFSDSPLYLLVYTVLYWGLNCKSNDCSNEHCTI